METKQTKIFSIKKTLLIAVLSYALYSILCLLIDDDLLPYNYSLPSALSDIVTCTIYSFISLALVHIIFRVLKFHTDFKWCLIYGCVLFVLNNIIAMIMNRICIMLYGDAPDLLFESHSLYTFAMLSTLVSSIYLITEFMDNYNKVMEEKQAAELSLFKEKEAALEFQLASLKMQINPHFLFNNFSTLSELIESSPETASDFLAHLSKVYRHIVRNLNVNLIDIRDELRFIDSYVYLMRLRYGDTIIVTINSDLRTSIGKIPPASLQLLVENAAKHNAFSSDKPLTITINIDDDHLVVRNNRQPMNSVIESTGIGLSNIISRYSLLSTRNVLIEDSEHYFAVFLPIL